MKQLRGRTPKESKDCPENCWRCSQFCGETRSNSSSALQSYFFPLISRLPGQTHLFQGHCKTGQNSSASCDQMASQTLCTKLSLGSRHLNSVPPMPFLSLTQGNISDNSPPHLFCFLQLSPLPAVSSDNRFYHLLFLGHICFLKTPVISFHGSALPTKLKLDNTIWLPRLCLHLQGLFALC